MGKRSNFKRRRRDYYPTPWEAVAPLVPHLLPSPRIAEPCAGDGRLIDHLRTLAGATCSFAGDVLPRRADVVWSDALKLSKADLGRAELIITNPPWDRAILHPLIEKLSALRLTWLLFDADWMHTRQASKLIRTCRQIVSVGRVKWMPGSANTGKDNAAWYLFDAWHSSGPRFCGR